VSEKIVINLEAVEAMLYYWHALKDREKVAEKFIYDYTEMPILTEAYDQNFDGESVRRTLSAIKNREVFSGRNLEEKRYWNNNMWMLEDMAVTDAMVQPLKQLNLDDLPGKLAAAGVNIPEEITVAFLPLHLETYRTSGNRLLINFFKVESGEKGATIEGQPVAEFIQDKVQKMLQK